MDLMSPQELYDNPSRFAGVLGGCVDTETAKVDLSTAHSVNKFMEALWSDWPSRLHESLGKVATHLDGRYYTFWSENGSIHAHLIDVTEFMEEVSSQERK